MGAVGRLGLEAGDSGWAIRHILGIDRSGREYQRHAPNSLDEILDDEYGEATEAAKLGAILINEVESHAHLQEAEIAYVFRDEEIIIRDKVESASAHLAGRLLGPSSKRWGRLLEWSIQRIVGFEADFIILIDWNIWSGLDEAQKIALIDHELSHCSQEEDLETGMPKFTEFGVPKWRILGHDVEEFCGVIERHGLWSKEVVDLARAVIDNLGAIE